MKSSRILRYVFKPLVFLHYELLQKRALKRIHRLGILGRPLEVFPGVFHPVIFGSGLFFAEWLEDEDLRPGSLVLELGCGTGLCSIIAASKGARVVAVDRNPEALKCTLRNSRLNQVENRIEVKESDLFEALKGRVFDLVLFNPPFLHGEARNDFEMAFRGDADLPGKFARGLRHHLKPEGRVLLMLSEEGRREAFLGALEAASYRLQRVAEKRIRGETYTLYSVRSAN